MTESVKKVVIRKYNNGKFYCSELRRYVNRKELLKIFKTYDVDIIEVETGANITNKEIPRICNGMKVNVNDIKDLFIFNEE